MTSGAGRPRGHLPRLLTVMGSGETAPTMVKVHRSVVERLGPGPVHGVLLDTPFGFQTNAPDIAARAVDYFRVSVGVTVEVAGVRTAADLDPPRGDAIIARIAEAPFVFSGPGSPSYALRQWRGTLVPAVLGEKLAFGGAITFASAAALTLGAVSVPVYEVYKVGEEPRWLEGLDLLGPLGLHVALIPHYDNAEGGTHDTRYSYLGEERLARLERDLPAGTFVLGVDEHTALCLDVDAGTASVIGHGGVTVRAHGRSTRLEPGTTVPTVHLVDLAEQLARRHGPVLGDGPTGRSDDTTAHPTGAEGASVSGAEGAAPVPSAAAPWSPLLDSIRSSEAAFRAARRTGDASAMTAAVLSLEDQLWAWRADTLQSTDMDRGRAALRAMIDELGRVAGSGVRDPAEVVGPYVELALTLRDNARSERRFDEADVVRDRLAALGVEVQDTVDGSSWVLSRPRAGGTSTRMERRPMRS